MNVRCTVCSSALNEYKNSDLYTITKCGHVYHSQCLKDNMYRKRCKKCHVHYDPRQCYKTYLFPEQNNPKDGNKEDEHYEWFYCDRKTEYKHDEFNDFALKLDTDDINDGVYAARVFLSGDILPAYYSPAKKMAISCIDGKVVEKTEDIDILDIISDKKEYYKWGEPGKVPENAFNIAEISENALTLNETGETIEDEKHYIIRAKYEGKMRYGKLSPNKLSKKYQAYIPYGREEIQIYNNYEVLVRDS